jgi:hypothetical protein
MSIALSPRQREIVTLVGRDGLAYAAVAEVLGISLHTVRTHVARFVDCVDAGNIKPRDALCTFYWQHIHKPGPREDLQPEPPPGFVYVMATTEPPERLKIGYSINVERRLHDLSMSSPVELCLLASWPGCMDDEARIHNAARDYRLHGEWFTMEAFDVVQVVMS